MKRKRLTRWGMRGLKIRRWANRLFCRRYKFFLPQNALLFTKSPNVNILRMVSEKNRTGNWFLWYDEIRMGWMAFCYNRPGDGGYAGIKWQVM